MRGQRETAETGRRSASGTCWDLPESLPGSQPSHRILEAINPMLFLFKPYTGFSQSLDRIGLYRVCGSCGNQSGTWFVALSRSSAVGNHHYWGGGS